MLFSASPSNQQSIKLITRVRPLQPIDHVLPTSYFQMDPAHGTIVLGNNRIFQLENILPFDCPQHLIFKNHVEPIVNACFEGYNMSVIAYGQTGSGKTFTVFGPGLLYAMNESDFGILPRAVRHLFYKAEEFPGRQISIQASYLEIYDEEIHDLLSVDPFHGEIVLQEDPNTGEVSVSGATTIDCHTIDDVFSCLETGLALRHTGPMFNQLSNKSHGIFTLYMQQRWTQGGCMYDVCSKLHFVDLAGSEWLGLNILNDVNEGFQSASGFQQPFSINAGLLALSNVTSALGDPRRKASHVPYWDSKLTCILKDSLGGNSFTLMIVCLSPSASHLQETHNALKFATRASNIYNRPKPNIRVFPVLGAPETFSAPQFYSTYGTSNQLTTPNCQKLFVDSNGLGYHDTSTFTISEEDRRFLVGAEPNDTADEVFRLRFAANQWQQLVTNAETLMNELVANGLLQGEAQNKVNSWLCLKEEYANCIDPDLIAMKPRSAIPKESNLKESDSQIFCSNGESKTLHVIEEVSEPTPTRELSCELGFVQHDRSHISISGDSSSSDSGSQFTEQLDLLRQHFREATDRLISNIETLYDSIKPSSFERTAEIENIDTNENNLGNLYRNSTNFNSDRRVLEMDWKEGKETSEKVPQKSRSLNNSKTKISFSQTCSSESELGQKMITAGAHHDQLSFKLSREQSGKEDATERHILEQSTSRHVKDDEIRSSGEERKAQSRWLNQHDDARYSKEPTWVIDPSGSSQEQLYNNREMGKSGNVDFKKTSNAEADDFKHACRFEIDNSLSKMKDDQHSLKELLRQENQIKHELKQEIDKDHKRILKLERQLKEQRLSSESRSHEFGERDEILKESELEHKWRWLVAEEERLDELRTEITWRSEELEERESNLEKRETALVKSLSQNESEKSLTHVESNLVESKPKEVESTKMGIQTLPENLTSVDGRADVTLSHNPSSDKEAIRREIRKMRHTRDSLVQQRQEIDEKQHRGLELDVSEERRMIELDEAIEAVDAAIEYKNELICSRHYELNSVTEDGLLTRLMSLTHAETRSLLCKYFQKVIDLREGSKKMEIQFGELEAQFEEQTRYVRKLTSALKHTQLEIERRSASHRRHYDLKSTGFQNPVDHGSRAESHNVYSDRKTNHVDEDLEHGNSRDLRRQLRDLLSVTPKNRVIDSKQSALPISSEQPPSAYGSRTPSLLGLQAVQALHQKITGLQRSRGRNTGPETTTTVTREKNKLIIKQQTVQSDSRETKRRHH